MTYFAIELVLLVAAGVFALGSNLCWLFAYNQKKKLIRELDQKIQDLALENYRLKDQIADSDDVV